MATPSSTMRAASFMASAWMRGTMKPGRAAHTTGTLPMPSSIALSRAVTAGSVRAPGDSSTSGMRNAGLSQWALRKRSGRSTAPDRSSTMMVDVVEAMMASGPASAEARARTSRLRSSTSGTPSKITAASARARPAWASPTTVTREAMPSTAAGANRPKEASVPSVLRTSAMASAATRANSASLRGLRSTIATRWPA